MATFDMPPASAGFQARGGWVAQHLMADLGLTLNQACGLVGNLGFESGGFKELQEIAPLAGGAGGYGWAQWTGPRRISFFNWATRNNLAPSSDEANYGYLVYELQNSQRATITALTQHSSLSDCVFSVGQTFERPYGTTSTNLPGFAGRLSYAQQALAGTQGVASVVQTTQVAPDDRVAVAAAVTNIQKSLNLHGAALVADGILGPLTLAAYQRIMA